MNFSSWLLCFISLDDPLLNRETVELLLYLLHFIMHSDSASHKLEDGDTNELCYQHSVAKPKILGLLLPPNNQYPKLRSIKAGM